MVEQSAHNRLVLGSNPSGPISGNQVIRISGNQEVKPMAEEKKAKNLDELLKQIEDFEKTIKGLEANVANLKKKLLENKEKYGPDLSSWPKE